ncbi:alpha/beta fold hydrolase [Streptomyces bobili]|uniref:alpha/beta fold hydrolase n=1 Tax=Streptomyces bobili TaxID=67280 RepID=UPI00224DC7F3|nr:alpha/beta hydrolase [Streptomyces bobili]MCX5526388.1 alpha/beta fold hydrolase [Streptomyces bobili]
MSSTELPSVPPTSVLPKAASVRVAEGERLRSVRLPGVTLTVRSRPATRAGLQPALYVHGLGGSSQNWSALMAQLDGVVESEAVDLPGFGDSPPPDDGNYSITAHARAVIRHLDASGRGPVHLFGNSLGGAVSTRVAAVRPDLVRTLTLVSPALPELRVQRTAVPTGLLGMPGVAALFTRFTREWTAEQRVRGVMALCYGDPGRVTPEAFGYAVEELERRLRLPYFWDAMTRSARGLVNAYTLGGQHGLWRQAERVLAPTLLVYGGRDQLVGFRMAQRAARTFRDSRLLTLPNAGHVAMMEYPETVATTFRELLEETAERGERGPRPESEAEPDTGARPEAGTGATHAARTGVRPDTDIGSRPDTDTRSRPDAGPDVGPDAGPDSGSGTGPGSGAFSERAGGSAGSGS